MASDGYISKYSVSSRYNLPFLISDIRALWCSARVPKCQKLKMAVKTWMAKCNQLTPLPFKGLYQEYWRSRQYWILKPGNAKKTIITFEQFLPLPAQTSGYTLHEILELHGQEAGGILEQMDQLTMNTCMSTDTSVLHWLTCQQHFYTLTYRRVFACLRLLLLCGLPPRRTQSLQKLNIFVTTLHPSDATWKVVTITSKCYKIHISLSTSVCDTDS